MCGRLVLIKYHNVDGTIGYYRMWTGKDAVDDIERLKKVFIGQSRFDIRPTQIIDVFTIDAKTNKHKVVDMKWGWKPEWTQGKPVMNTRIEGAAQNRLWSKAFRERRCVVPATHFYEWQRREDSHKNVPWMIKRKGHEYMYFAGLYIERENENTGESFFEVSIVTESGNKFMQEVHNHGGNAGRQPVYVDEDKIPDWLDPSLKDPEKIQMLLRHIEDGEYEGEMLEEIGNDKTHTPPRPRQQNLF
jgi:putative SOS response-associated peptidase YedK